MLFLALTEIPFEVQWRSSLNYEQISTPYVSSDLLLEKEPHFEILPDHCNRVGTAHGGLLATYADFIMCMIAARYVNLKEGRIKTDMSLQSSHATTDLPYLMAITLNLGIDFISSVHVGETIFAQLDVFSDTNRIIFCR
jgi:acyl-coenzyme A thioesterase PaaI-like protein